MGIFISWSGSDNKPIGQLTRSFVADVLGSDDIFMSDLDVLPGERSLERIDRALSDASAALLVVSRASMKKPWLNFEAGAIAFRVNRPMVTPILLDLDFSDLIQPIAQFQGIRYDDQPRMLTLMHSLNRLRGDLAIRAETITIVFNAKWDDFLDQVGSLVAAFGTPDQGDLPTDQDKLDELLVAVRSLTNATSNRKSGVTAGDLSEESPWERVRRQKGSSPSFALAKQRIMTRFPHAIAVSGQDEQGPYLDVTLAKPIGNDELDIMGDLSKMADLRLHVRSAGATYMFDGRL